MKSLALSMIALALATLVLGGCNPGGMPSGGHPLEDIVDPGFFYKKDGTGGPAGLNGFPRSEDPGYPSGAEEQDELNRDSDDESSYKLSTPEEGTRFSEHDEANQRAEISESSDSSDSVSGRPSAASADSSRSDSSSDQKQPRSSPGTGFPGAAGRVQAPKIQTTGPPPPRRGQSIR